MEQSESVPVLMSRVGGKYGRRDYQRFDNIASTHMRAGRGSIGKVEVDCRFMFTKSRWGVIGENQNPGGIIYLDLDFRQPPDCRLRSATVTVTLTEDDGEETSSIARRSGFPVEFTDHYGPKCLRGKQSLVQTKKVKNRTPNVQLFGYGASGMGNNKEKVVQTSGRWNFSGHIGSSKGCVFYNKLQWELEETSLEHQPTHNNLIHTAFAIAHNATRFYMTVHVSGKLANLSNKIRNRLKFGEKSKEDDEVVTKIEWSGGYSCPMKLDRIARDLHQAMELANMSKVPVELPGALPVEYHPAITTAPPATTSAQQAHQDPPVIQQQPFLQPLLGAEHPMSTPQASPDMTAQQQEERQDQFPQTAQQHTPERPWLGLENVASSSGRMHQLPSVTLDELRMANAGVLPQRPPLLSTENMAGETEVEEVSEFSSSSATLVNSAVSTQPGEEGGSEAVAGTWKKYHPNNSDSRDQKQGVWLGITALLLHWLGRVGVLLLSLAGMVGFSVKVKSHISEREKSRHRKGKKAKATGLASNWETARSVRGRMRGRRGQRLSLSAGTGKRTAEMQDERL